ncbi:hypothetical protein [Geothrix oryzisoli]|uniref:hypothetical protein n=1 Tax=Geothrix oryzisoli TaxID=2922721 RepID=UPI001FACBF6B|nr:hypothetical protein [Geothrix oryzisoli]
MDDWLDRIREQRGTLVAAALIGVLGLWWWGGRARPQPAGILAPEDPVQTSPEAATAWTFHDHLLTPLAAFEIRARVLSVERYRFDRPAELSPVDLTLGWGPMSDSRVLEAFTIEQRDRWYFWRAAHMPIPEAEVISHSANMHMIPADEGIARRLKAARVGQLVHLKGQLVRADGKDGWHWVSSLSRTDTGDGSCEVIWVQSATVADRPPDM